METVLGGHTEKLLSQRNVVRARDTSNFLVVGNAYVCDRRLQRIRNISANLSSLNVLAVN
jgi:hypothetical protein